MEKQYTVLAVDDEDDMLLITKMTLQTDGYNVLTAQDGPTAIEKARKDKPDLIVLDVIMPGMDGFEVLEKLREDEETRDLPVVMLTVLSERERHRAVIERGVKYYVVKPFDTKDLLVKVRSAIQDAEARGL